MKYFCDICKEDKGYRGVLNRRECLGYKFYLCDNCLKELKKFLCYEEKARGNLDWLRNNG
jgi:hypothetical protein